MAPPRSVLNLQFLKGLRTNTDPRLQLEGELTQLTNGQVSLLGAISKRPGYEALTRSTSDGATMSLGRGLAIFGDELATFDGEKVYAYSPALLKWINRGKARSVITSAETIIRNDGYQQLYPDSATNNGYECHAWQDERGGVRYTLIDATTRTRLVADTEVTATGERPKVLALGNYILILYRLSDSVRFRAIDTVTSPLTLGSQTSIATSIQADPEFDACVTSASGTTKAFVVYEGASGSTIATRTITTALVVSSATTVSTPGGLSALCIFPGLTGNNNACWIGRTEGSVVEIHSVNFSNAVNLTNRTLETVADVYRLCGYADATTGVATYLYEVAGSDNHFTNIRKNTVTTTGTVGSASVFARSVGLVSKPFRHSTSDTWYVGCAHHSSQQSTIFVLDEDGGVAVKAAYQTAGGLASAHVCTSVLEPSSGVFTFDHSAKGKELSEGELFFSRLGVRRLQLDFTSHNGFVNVATDNQLVTVGGVVQSYDRNSFVELNYHLYPENISATASTADGELTLEATYQYRVIFVWTDAAGNVHESRPSTPVEITLTGSENTVELTIPTLRLTSKSSGVRIDVYRTQNGGTVFRKVSSTADPLYNEPTADTVTFVDEVSDATLDSAQLLYTEGERANLAPPAAGLITSWKNRLFLGNLETGNELWFTKLLTPGIAAEFCEDTAFRVPVNSQGGAMTDLAPLDDALIIFRERAIYGLTGEGPNNAGQGSDYYDPQQISNSLGAVRTNCVVDTPPGLMFVSAKGIHLLGRDKSLSYLGEPVAAYDGYTFTSADRIPDTTQVRFVTSEGPCLVYDYHYNIWSVWSGASNFLAGVDAAVWQDQHVVLTSDGYLKQERASDDADLYLDNDGYVNLSLATSWYFPAGSGGYCQLDKVYVSGEYVSNHTLTVVIQTDNIETTRRTYTINTGAIVGSPARYSFTLEPRLRCESFRVLLSESGPGASAKWSGLRAEVAPLYGTFRQPSKRRASA